MDDEYFRRYARLHEMIRECYVDYYILLGMRNFINSSDKTGKIPNYFWGIINHHCRLTKEHLALILWKLTDDHQNKSNTIITLKNIFEGKIRAEQFNFVKRKYAIPQKQTYTNKEKDACT